MKSLLVPEAKESLIRRIESICPDDRPQWGKMNAGEMVCHVSDQLRIAMKKKDSEFIGRKRIAVLLKWLIIFGMPAPKGKVETVKEMKAGSGGTMPSLLENDKSALLGLINEFEAAFPPGARHIHPAFGPMSKRQWGRLSYIHLDYHLKQFGK